MCVDVAVKDGVYQFPLASSDRIDRGVGGFEGPWRTHLVCNRYNFSSKYGSF